MSLVLFGLAWASAPTVSVDDRMGCVDREAVQLEVGAVLDAHRADAVEVEVGIDDGVVSLEVFRGQRVLWDRRLSVGPEDCAVVPALIARSLDQGLAGLPDWHFEAADGLPPDVAVYLEGAVAPVPSPFGWGVLGTGSGPLGRVGRWSAGLGVVAIRVDDGAGRGAQLLAPQLRMGPGADLGRRRRWRLVGVVTAGPVFVVPQTGVQLSGPRWVPGARGEVSLAWRRGSLAVSGFVDTPLVRVVVVDEAQGERLAEGVIRVGLRVGAIGSLGSR